MRFSAQSIPEVVLIQPLVLGDERGYFFESFRRDLFENTIGYKVDFIQDNESRSAKGVLRGLHFQIPPFTQSKLVRVIKGEVLDVAVDIRKNSPTFGKHVSALLSAENKCQLFIPRGFAHGFVVLSEEAIFSYKVDNYYSAECDRGLLYSDPDLGIDWLMPVQNVTLSEKDQKQPLFKELGNYFEYEENYYNG